MIAFFDLLMMIVSTIFAAAGGLCFKFAGHRLKRSLIHLITNWWIYAGGLLYVLSNILFIIPLKRVDLSILYGIGGMTYIWTLLFGRLIFKEKITGKKLIAITLIIIGVFIINL